MDNRRGRHAIVEHLRIVCTQTCSGLSNLKVIARAQASLYGWRRTGIDCWSLSDPAAACLQ